MHTQTHILEDSPYFRVVGKLVRIVLPDAKIESQVELGLSISAEIMDIAVVTAGDVVYLIQPATCHIIHR